MAAGSVFKQAVKEETGMTWEEWLTSLGQSVDPRWSHEQIAGHIADEFKLPPRWGEIIALMYGQQLGRKPVGLTASAGVQIGVRRTLPISKERVWTFLMSRDGLQLWIGDLPALPLEVGHKYMSKEGTCGQIKVMVPLQKIRMTWQRKEWDNPSTLQIYLLSGNANKTTISFHQEKLDDIYMREMMKLHWEQVLGRISDHCLGEAK